MVFTESDSMIFTLGKTLSYLVGVFFSDQGLGNNKSIHKIQL